MRTGTFYKNRTMELLHIGIDIGAATAKAVVLDGEKNVLFSTYRRHLSEITRCAGEILREILEEFSNHPFSIVLTGSGSLDISEIMELDFIQEVMACKIGVMDSAPEADVVLEIGGEDSKVIFLKDPLEYRMNSACAGGTGVFIDQMAGLLDTDAIGLNELAKHSRISHTIAARCGVFAKADIQGLLSVGAAKEDVGAAVFRAVARQTIGTLSCGRNVAGSVVFAGGPFQYLSELRTAFADYLDLSSRDIVAVEESHLVIAKGAAISSIGKNSWTAYELIEKVDRLSASEQRSHNVLAPLFKDEDDYQSFEMRHQWNPIPKVDIECCTGPFVLGIDAGSTTSKLVLITEAGEIAFSLYERNSGDPLDSVVGLIRQMYHALPHNAVIVKSAVTGYGEALIRKILNIDIGEVETVAHYRAAVAYAGNVDTIIDIGGQDMKYMAIENGRIKNVVLNETCSSGCGSFLASFAETLNVNLDEFGMLALSGKTPVDLGTRCTVFMNSKVRQAQKEGSTVEDIAAGLAYSVARNALHKLIGSKLPGCSGQRIVLQGGVFYNPAVLRAFEKTLGQECIRPVNTGLMGAYGVALIALEAAEAAPDSPFGNGLVSRAEIEALQVSRSGSQCEKCENRCLLTHTRFGGQSSFVSGNRCERGMLEDGGTIPPLTAQSELPNLYKYKYFRVFDYIPTETEYAPKGVIGIPRVLNIYETYPFWFAFFTALGFRVVLSDRTTQTMYEAGLSSVPSESVCFPAKSAHGHILNLAQKGIKTVFYPCLPYERQEDGKARNCFSCPVVSGYPEVLRNNMTDPVLKDVELVTPYLSLWQGDFVSQFLRIPYFISKGFNRTEIKAALRQAQAEYSHYQSDVRAEGDGALITMKEKGIRGIVLAGRPYHIDPAINKGIDRYITSLGLAVISEDAVSHLKQPGIPLRVLDQWVYPTRQYSAASVVCEHKNLELIQLNSFGCGLDAITIGQVEDILSSAGKIHTILKLDEISNRNAIEIRIRSLIRSVESLNDTDETHMNGKFKSPIGAVHNTTISKKHTLLVPQIDPIQSEILKTAFASEGYEVEFLKEITPETIETGLRYVNNDICYPAIMVIGQLLHALVSGAYDKNRVALVLSQSGCGCRDSNYIGLLRSALIKAGYPEITVVSWNFVGLEKGFRFTARLINKLTIGTIYSDLLRQVVLRVRPYETETGSAELLLSKWIKRCEASVRSPQLRGFSHEIAGIIREFDALPILETEKPVVAIVGELFLKYNSQGNNHLIALLEKEGAEVTLPTSASFSQFMISHPIIRHRLYGNGVLPSVGSGILLKILDIYLSRVKETLVKYPKFHESEDVFTLSERIQNITSIGNLNGEGWYLPAKMVDSLEHGINNIICIQPFGCLSNHITGKGILKPIKSRYPAANLIALDYDAGFSESNQINRIKLFMEIARSKAPDVTSEALEHKLEVM